MKRRSPLRRISAKREAQLEERRRTIAIVRERDVVCQLRYHSPCWGPLDVHERLPRSRGGDWLNPAACVLLCRGHHWWIHDNPADGVAVGMLAQGYHWVAGQVEE